MQASGTGPAPATHRRRGPRWEAMPSVPSMGSRLRRAVVKTVTLNGKVSSYEFLKIRTASRPHSSFIFFRTKVHKRPGSKQPLLWNGGCPGKLPVRIDLWQELYGRKIKFDEFTESSICIMLFSRLLGCVLFFVPVAKPVRGRGVLRV